MSFVGSDLAKNFMKKMPHRERVLLASKYPSFSPEVCISICARMYICMCECVCSGVYV